MRPRAAASREPSQPPTTAPTAAAPPSFLVIDDDPVHRMVMGKVGEKAGYVVTTAGTVEDAAMKISEQKYHCISLDIALHGQSGNQVLRGIARSNGDVLLLVVSSAAAEVREETVESARNLRLKVMEIPKPVDLAALRRELVSHATLAKVS
jgi:two-component system, chemotaxis family, chemotaxis protein CheY